MKYPFKALYERTAAAEAALQCRFLLVLSFGQKLYHTSQATIGDILVDSFSGILLKLRHQCRTAHIHFVSQLLRNDFFCIVSVDIVQHLVDLRRDCLSSGLKLLGALIDIGQQVKCQSVITVLYN